MYKLVDSMTRPYFSQEFNYNINGLVVRLPAGHRLPFYQAKFPKYDKFLPYIAKRLVPGDGVLDIGANCGDTLASLVSAGPELRYYCVEPSDNYFKYLGWNIESIKKSFPLVSINCVKCLVGKSSGAYSLIEKNGTAVSAKIYDKDALVGDDNAILTKTTLNDLVKSPDGKFKLRLLKTDTDGSDSDVIDSGLEIIKEAKPILFFECAPENDEAYLAYQSTFEKLSNLGYNNFYIFDNYGEYISSVKESRSLVDFMRYCFKNPKPTIFYIDVMACVSKDVPLVEAAIGEFQKEVKA